MPNIANIVEAVAATSATFALGAKPAYKFIAKRTRERTIDDLFLHGDHGIPGVRPALMPANERLTGVETGLTLANNKLDAHDEKLDRILDTSSRTANTLATVAHEVQVDAGASLKDSAARIEAEQHRVAEEHAAEKTT